MRFHPNMEWLFSEYDLPEMDLESHRGIIIEHMLEKGSWEQLCCFFEIYSEAHLAD
jgi:hypothetical protein